MNFNLIFLYKTTSLTILLSSVLFCFAQLPADLPWPGEQCQDENILLQSGIVALTCGASTDVPAGQRWTFGLVDIDGALPGNGRTDVTPLQNVYHHPSWELEQLGNVFGIAINETNGCIFTTASSNYGAGFTSAFSSNAAVTQYGSIGGGADDLGAAGTVYKIDAVTGQASVFAQLPQQATTFTHEDCEGPFTNTRTTGVGLGNIVYDETHDQYFVSNIEDGRIYRLDNAGVILDSYDPLIYDDGAPGISNINDLAYGLAVTDDGSRLFFGQIVTPGGGQGVPGTGNIPIYAIDLLPGGGFNGTVDNTVLPTGVPNNYVGTETLQTTIPVGGNGGTFTSGKVFQISDLHFDPNGNLLVGVRISCQNGFHGSYNHWGETNIVMPDANGIYNVNVSEYDIGVTGDAGPDDNYGGVTSWDLQDGSGDIQYVISSADILEEVGPHGIAVFESTASTNTQVNPVAAISYGVTPAGDPKGVGGDVEVFNNCCLITCSITPQSADCGFINGSITAVGAGAKNGNYLYSLDGFTTPGQPSGLFSDLASGSYTVTVRDADVPACENTCEVEVMENVNTLNCSLTAVIANCGVANGGITATGTGAPSGSYLFSLDGFATAGQSSSTFSNLTPGSYTVTVRDAGANISACESTCQIEVTEDNVPKCINEFGSFTVIKNRP